MAHTRVASESAAPPSASGAAVERQEHPAPHRHRVGLFAQWSQLVVAPLAWSLQLMVDTVLESHGCFPHQTPIERNLFSHAPGLMGATVAVVTVACVAGFLLAARNWRCTRAERPGLAHHVMEAGDGRTRFLALAGMIVSGLFLLAVLVHGAMLLEVPPCGLA